jgi:hypothetical protein
MAAANNPARGNELPHAKLTPEIVADIRKRAPTTAHRVLAAEYGVHVNTIQRAASYANWWHK